MTDATAPIGKRKYKAFMSYSHAGDQALAPRLQSALQTFARPFWRLRSMRIFRDETTLAVTPHLWPDIAAALDQSDFFILLASPDSARSKWVGQEVSHWLQRNPADTLLIVRTSGAIAWDDRLGDFDWSRTDALPGVLKNVFKHEPKWEDLAAIRSGRDISARNPVLQKVTASLFSTMTGRPLDEVIGDDVARHRQTWSAITVGGAFVAILAFGIYQSYSAWQMERIAALKSQSTTLAALSLQQNKHQRFENAVLTAIKAVPDAARCDADRPLLPEAEWGLRASVNNHQSNLQPRHIVKHDGQVYSLALSSDGAHLASGSSGGTIRVFDVASWELVATLEGHVESVLGLNFSPDDRYIVSSGGRPEPNIPSQDNAVRVWDWRAGRLLFDALPHGAHVYVPSFSPRGDRIMTASGAGATIWDAAAGQKTFELSGPSGHTDKVVAAVWNADGALVATGGFDGAARIWDASNGTVKRTLADPAAPMKRVRRVAFLAGGSRLVTASDDYIVRIWDLESGAVVASSRGHKGQIWGLALSADGKRFATTSIDGTARIYTAETGEVEQVLHGHASKVQGAQFSRDGKTILTWSQDGSARIWSVESGKAISLLLGHSNSLNAARLLPDDDSVVTASDDGYLKAWARSAGAGSLVLRSDDFPSGGRRGRKSVLSAAAFSADGRYAVVGSYNRKAAVFDAVTGQQLTVFENHRAPVLGAAISPDASVVATASGNTDGSNSEDDAVRIWDRASGQEIDRLPHDNRVRAVEFSQDGKRLVTAVGNNRAEIWKYPREGAQPLRLEGGHKGPVTSASWNASGTMVATSSTDRTVRLWNAETGQQFDPGRPIRLSDTIYKVSWMRFQGADCLLTASGDSRIALWRSDTRQPIVDIDDQVEGDGDWFQWVSQIPALGDGPPYRILAVTDKGAVRIWDIIPDDVSGAGKFKAVEVAKFSAYDNPINSAVSDVAGKRLIFAHRDGAARIVEIGELAPLLAKARDTVSCCVTPQERHRYAIGAAFERCKQQRAWLPGFTGNLSLATLKQSLTDVKRYWGAGHGQ